MAALKEPEHRIPQELGRKIKQAAADSAYPRSWAERRDPVRPHVQIDAGQTGEELCQAKEKQQDQ